MVYQRTSAILGISRRAFLAAMSVGIGTGLGACGAPAPPTPVPAEPAETPPPAATAKAASAPTVATKAAAKPTFTKVLKLFSNPTVTNAQLFVMASKKLLEAEGLEPQIDFSALSPADTVKLITGNQIQFATINPSGGTNNALQRGSSMLAIAGGAVIPPKDRPNSSIMVSEKAWNAGVRSVRDLKGKTINVFPGVDTASGQAVRLVLQKAGLDPVKDAELQGWADAQQMNQAFLGGAADIIYSVEPSITVLKKQGGRTLPESSSSDVLASVPSLLLWVSREWTENNDEGVVRFLRAYLLGTKYFLDAANSKLQQNADVVSIIAKETKVPEAIVKEMNLPDFPADGSINVKGLQDTMQFFKEVGSISDIVPPDRYVQEKWVKEAYRQLKGEGKL